MRLMNSRYKNFLTGLGSVLEIAPSRDFQALVPTLSPEDRMRRHFSQSGDAIRRATRAYTPHDDTPAQQETPAKP